MTTFRLAAVLLLPLCTFMLLGSFVLEAAGTSPISAADSAPFNLNLTVVAEGLKQPTDIAHTQILEDGRLFITERAGTIRIVNEDGSLETSPFLNITERVFVNHIEAGLLGLVFDPDYANNGYFYVTYIHKPSEDIRLSRFQVSSGNPNLADADSETIILNLPKTDSGHNGGDMQFGTDGYLYVGIGDGGLVSELNGQDFTNLLGTILRLDLDPAEGLPSECGSGSTHYSIPADNPFVGVQEGTAADPCNEIWVYGLRNPWRFSLDRTNQDLYIGDVGMNTWEEIDYVPAHEAAGTNLGWACYEGHLRINQKGSCHEPEPVYTPPVFDYPHGEGCAVTGGFVYRGEQSVTMIGHYLFADFCTGHILSLAHTQNGWQAVDHGKFMKNPSAFGEDVNGELYVVSLSEGRLYHLADDTIPSPKLAIQKSAPLKVTSGEPVTYSLTISNSGNAAAHNLVVTDKLPTGTVWQSGGTLGDSYVTWTEATLAPQASLVVTMVVSATQTLLNHTYFVSADDNHLATGYDTIITFIDPDEIYLPVVIKE